MSTRNGRSAVSSGRAGCIAMGGIVVAGVWVLETSVFIPAISLKHSGYRVMGHVYTPVAAPPPVRCVGSGESARALVSRQRRLGGVEQRLVAERDVLDSPVHEEPGR